MGRKGSASTACTPFLHRLELVRRGTFEHIIWMAHTDLFTDCDNLFFYLLILTKPACDRSLVSTIDPPVCGMDVIATFIAFSTMPLYEDMVFQHFKENTNVFVFLILLYYYYYWLNFFYMPKYMYFKYICEIT